MARGVTLAGNPLTLAGDELTVGQQAPDFTLHYFADGMHELTLADLKGKPTLVSVVPSLDTPVCATQTSRFNQELAALGDNVNAVTVSCDLPFAQARFCGAEDIGNMRTGSDYRERSFGADWGTLINELKILARAVYVLDADGKVVYGQLVPEVTQETGTTRRPWPRSRGCCSSDAPAGHQRGRLGDGVRCAPRPSRRAVHDQFLARGQRHPVRERQATPGGVLHPHRRGGRLRIPGTQRNTGHPIRPAGRDAQHAQRQLSPASTARVSRPGVMEKVPQPLSSDHTVR